MNYTHEEEPTSEIKLRDRSFELYNSLFQHGETPQQEGLDAQTFQEALQDERTKIIKIGDQESVINLPVLVPLEKQTWFSKDFFENEFKDEISTGKSLYYVATPLTAIERLDIELQTAWLSVLHEAAEEGAVIIFEANELDDVERMKTVLSEDHMTFHEHFLWEESISSESHFGGKGRVSRHKDKTQLSTLQEGYERLLSSGQHTEDRENGTVMLTDIDNETIEELWKIYEGPFEELSSEHPIRQGLTKDEFNAMLQSEEVVKIAHYTEGKIASLCFLVEDLSLCSWLDPDYYAEKFPDEVVFYFPGIVTDPERQGNRYIEKLIALIGGIATEAQINPVITFETCDTNTLFLPDLIEDVINSDPRLVIEFDELARHYYHAIKFIEA